MGLFLRGEAVGILCGYETLPDPDQTAAQPSPLHQSQAMTRIRTPLEAVLVMNITLAGYPSRTLGRSEGAYPPENPQTTDNLVPNIPNTENCLVANPF